MLKILLLTTVVTIAGCKLVKSSQENSATLASVTPETSEEITGRYTQNQIAAESAAVHHYNSTIVELGSDHLMSCWFAAGKEPPSATTVFCSEKIAEAAWSNPRSIVDGVKNSSASPNQSTSSPVLFKDQEGTIWLFYDVEENNKTTIGFKISKDNGQTFSAGEKLNGDFANLRSKPLQLSSGRFMMPIFKNVPQTAGYIVMLTPDQGIVRDSKIIVIPGFNHQTPALTLKEDERGVNKVFAYLSDEQAKNIIVSEYDFIAGSFSPIKPSNIPNPKSAVDAVTTDNNQILMVYNDSVNARTPLSLGVSEDGITFRKIWDFETAEGVFSNPSFIRDQAGNFHLTYTQNQKTIKYITFDSVWLSLKLLGTN
jgi:predicted neuraminidase